MQKSDLHMQITFVFESMKGDNENWPFVAKKLIEMSQMEF